MLPLAWRRYLPSSHAGPGRARWPARRKRRARRTNREAGTEDSPGVASHEDHYHGRDQRGYAPDALTDYVPGTAQRRSCGFPWHDNNQRQREWDKQQEQQPAV